MVGDGARVRPVHGVRGVRIAVFLAAAAMTAAVVVVTGDVGGRAHEASDHALLLLAHRADAASYRVDYDVTRTIADGGRFTQRTAEWVRADPPLVVTVDDDTATVSDTRRTWACTRLDGPPQCLLGASGGITRGADSFAVAIASDRYTVRGEAAQRIAGNDARCWSLRLRGRRPALNAIGERLDVCLATRDGILLLSRRVSGGVVDTRRARDVDRRFDPAQLSAVARGVTDGSVSALGDR